jgi:hypothetical protein
LSPYGTRDTTLEKPPRRPVSGPAAAGRQIRRLLVWIYASPSCRAVFRWRPPPSSSSSPPPRALLAPPSEPAAHNLCGLRGRRQRVTSFSFLVERTWPLGRSVGAARAGRVAAPGWPDSGLPRPDQLAATVDLPPHTATTRRDSRGALLSLGRHVRPPWPNSASLGPRGVVVVASFPLSVDVPVIATPPPLVVILAVVAYAASLGGFLIAGCAPWVTAVVICDSGWLRLTSSSVCLVVAWLVAVRCVSATCGTLLLWSVFFIGGMREGVSSSPWHYKLSVLHVGFLNLLRNQPRVAFCCC